MVLLDGLRSNAVDVAVLGGVEFPLRFDMAHFFGQTNDFNIYSKKEYDGWPNKVNSHKTEKLKFKIHNQQARVQE